MKAITQKLISLLFTAASALAQQYVISTVAGGVPIPTPIAATSASIGAIYGIAGAAAGEVYFIGYGYSVYKVDARGVLSRVAGNGRSGFSGDGGPATSAQLGGVVDVTVDGAGNLYIVDAYPRIRKVAPNGIITTVAGSDSPGYSGDGGPATRAQLSPTGVAVDTAGTLYIAEQDNNRIRKVATDGIITTVAGNGTHGYSGDGGPATSAQLYRPYSVTVDVAGNLYVADTTLNHIRKIATNGIITTVAGNGPPGHSGDGGLATNAQLTQPDDVALDAAGNLYIADSGRIRKVTPNGIITTVAGDSSAGYSGDGGPARAAQLAEPDGVSMDAAGNLYIADTRNNRIRKVATDGVITTVAGNGNFSFPGGGDGGPATSATVGAPSAVAVDAKGNIYIAELISVRKVATNGTITTVAGNGLQGYSGDGGSATNAQLSAISCVALDGADNLYIADGGNNRIRKVATNGTITTVAGNGSAGYSGDGGPATSARLFHPFGVVIDGTGALYIADSSNHRIRKVATNGIITTVAGNGSQGYSGDGGPATSAQLSRPRSVVVDAVGNLYVANSTDSVNYHIRKIATNGVITTIAGSGSTGDSDQGQVAVDAAGNVFVADSFNNGIRMLTPLSPVLTASAPANAASNLTGPVASGEIVVLYGSGIGPAQLALAHVDDLGRYGTNLSGARVLFNGTPAPMIYTWATQVSAIVPYNLNGNTASVQIEYQGAKIDPISVPVAPSAPGVFTLDSTGKGQAAAFNEDGSLNTASRPAKVGSIVSLYATGEGQTSPAGVDGKPATPPFPQPQLSVQVAIDGKPAEVLYAGGAPGLVAGLMQVNARIPAGAQVGNVPVVVIVGSVSSQAGVTIAVAGN